MSRRVVGTGRLELAQPARRAAPAPGPPRSAVRARLRRTLLLALLALAPAGPVAAAEQSARASAQVGPGDTYTARLGAVPGGARLSIRISSDLPVDVILLDERDYLAFPDLEGPLFEGRADDELRFSLRVPTSGDYYLVIDNRDGDAARAVTLAVTASADAAAPADLQNRLERAHAELERFERNLRRLFVFDELDIRIRRCGTANTFADAVSDTIYICAELGRKLLEGTDDRAQARNIFLFAVLHEVGHVLLRQWDYPFYENEEVADEFATVLLVMLGQGERARSLVDYFAGLSPEEELARKRDRDDRHPLSVQRARTIGGWLEDPGLARRWQKVLVPHMQTDVLQALARSPTPWTAPDRVAHELEARHER